jgi:Cu(I)-responsive transcriptional regulator
MNIGELSRLSGVSTKMIRHYENIGLTERAHRSQSSYRVYGESDIRTLRFIRSARDLGFAMHQIKALLELWKDGTRASADVKAIALEHISELEERVEAITKMTRTLRDLVDQCHGDARPGCPIIEGIDNMTPFATRHGSKFGNSQPG